MSITQNINKKNILEAIVIILFLICIIILNFLPFSKQDLVLIGNQLINIYYSILLLICILFFILSLFINGNKLVMYNIKMVFIAFCCIAIISLITYFSFEFLNNLFEFKDIVLISSKLASVMSFFSIIFISSRDGTIVNIKSISKSLFLVNLIIFIIFQNIYTLSYLFSFTFLSIIPDFFLFKINELVLKFKKLKFYEWLYKYRYVVIPIISFLWAMWFFNIDAEASGKGASAAKKAAGAGGKAYSLSDFWKKVGEAAGAAAGTEGTRRLYEGIGTRVADLEGRGLVRLEMTVSTGEKVICEKALVNPIALYRGDVSVSVSNERCYSYDPSTGKVGAKSTSEILKEAVEFKDGGK